MYNTTTLVSLAPLVHNQALGMPVPSWWDPGLDPMAPRLMTSCSCRRAPSTLGGRRFWVLGTIRSGALQVYKGVNDNGAL
jgi:hypothetical protein